MNSIRNSTVYFHNVNDNSVRSQNRQKPQHFKPTTSELKYSCQVNGLANLPENYNFQK